MKEYISLKIQKALEAYFSSQDEFHQYMEQTKDSMTVDERMFLVAAIENLPERTSSPLETIAELLLILSNIRSKLSMLESSDKQLSEIVKIGLFRRNI